MSQLTGHINAILSHLQNMCEHDLARLQKMLSTKPKNINPDCYACQQQTEKQQFIKQHHTKNKK